MKSLLFGNFLVYLPSVFGCCMWLGCQPLAAQRIRSITSHEGLSQGFVAGVVQGEDGYIWASTLNGLDRFDGESFKTYRHHPADSGSIASNIVTGLEKDRKGNLWVLTKLGIQMYDITTDCFITPVVGSGNAAILKARDVVCFDQHDQLWVFAGYQICVYKITRNTVSGKLKIALGLVGQFDFTTQNIGLLNTILPTASGVMIGTTTNRLYTVDLLSGAVSLVPVQINGRICRIWEGPNGEGIWVQAETETILINGTEQRRFPIKTIKTFSNCSGLPMDGHTLIFGLREVYRWDGRQMTQLPFQIPEEIIAACVDHQGNLWIGTNAQGIRYVTVNAEVFPAIQRGKSSSHPVVADKQNNIWVFDPVVYSGDVGYYRKLMPDGSLGAPLTDKTCKWMDVDEQGRYWFVFLDGTIGYLERPGGTISPHTFTTPGYLSDKVFCPAGRDIWFTTNRHTLISYNHETKKEAYITLDPTASDRNILQNDIFQTSLVKDIQNRVWIGLPFAVWGLVWDSQNSRYNSVFLKRNTGPAQSQEIEVLAVAPDANQPDVLWAGGPDGLVRWDIKTRDYQLITVKDGLIDDFIYSVVPDDLGNLWLGTNKGLVEYNPGTQHCRTFSTLDGIPGSEFNTSSSLKTKNNRIYMNTVSGITWFDPARVNRVYPKSRMTFTNISANGVPQTVVLGSVQRYQFSYNQNSLSIDFALLNYIKPEENRYEYQLLGEKAGWIQLGHKNNVAFPQIAPGNYVFQVRGISSDGQVSEPVTFEFTILPPWWKTWWAYCCYILAAGGLIVAGVYAWLRFERVKTALLLKEQTASAEQFRTRLLSNITHEIRTPLTLIIGLADQLKKYLGGEDLKKINLIAKSGEDLLQLSNQVLELAKQEVTAVEPQLADGNLGGLTRQIADYFQYLAAVKPLQLDIQLPEDPVWARYDESAVKSILTNMLSNALKFTPAHGTIKLTMHVENDAVIFFEIKDNGIGMNADEMAHIFDRFYQAEGPQKLGGSGIGLSYVKELVDRMQGTVTVDSQPGEGSAFRIRIPHIPASSAAGEEYLLPFGKSATAQEESTLPVVLIVEDNQAVAQFMMECFRNKYATLYAPDGHTGFKMALEYIPDVIITDIMMPGINGLELCERVKKDPYTSHIPVIMATALVEKEAELSGRRSGADAYIAKPFLQEELLLVTGNLLQLRVTQHQFWSQQVEKDAGVDGVDAAENQDSVTAPPDAGISPNDLALLQTLNQLIEAHFKNGDYTVAELQKDIGVSKTQLHRKLTALTGKSAVHFLKQRRLKEARKLLKENPDMNIAQVSYACGFNDPTYFSAAFSAAYGVSPRQFREG